MSRSNHEGGVDHSKDGLDTWESVARQARELLCGLALRTAEENRRSCCCKAGVRALLSWRGYLVRGERGTGESCFFPFSWRYLEIATGLVGLLLLWMEETRNRRRRKPQKKKTKRMTGATRTSLSGAKSECGWGAKKFAAKVLLC